MEDLNMEFKGKTNQELRDEILALNRKQLTYIKESSFLTVLDSILKLKEMLDSLKERENIINSDEFRIINNYLKEIMELNEEIVELGLEQVRQDKIERLYTIRKELYKFFSIIEGYSRELNYITMLIDHYVSKLIAERDYKDSKYDRSDILELIDFISKKLDDAKNDYSKYTNIISLVISVLPMRLVKETYYNVLRSSFIRNYSNSTRYEVEKKINDYKRIFDSSMFDGYGTKFDYYFREIQNYRNMDFSNKDFDELDKITEASLKLSEELLVWYDLLIELGILVNRMIVISLIGEDLDSDEIEDIYYDWKELETDRSHLDELVDRLKLGIENIEKEMFEELEIYYALNREALGRKDFNYEDLSQELLKTKEILTYYNDINFNSEKLPSLYDEQIVSPSYLEQVSNSLVEYINRALATMGNLERKIRMRNLLAAIDLPFSGIGEFFDYIEYSLDIKVSSKEMINLLIDYIYYVLDEVID